MGEGRVRLNDEAGAVYRVQDYAAQPVIDGVKVTELIRHHDAGGSMTELLRLSAGRAAGLDGFDVAQINYSVVEPGAIKAFHVHRRQTDVWFVPPEDRVLLVLCDVRADSPTEGLTMRLLLGAHRAALVTIPAGVAHGCRNPGAQPARILYFADRAFSPDPATCDEGRLPWDYAGPEVWEIPRE